jgi:plastocyanin
MRITHALTSLLFAIAMPALGANHIVGFGDDCLDWFTTPGCFLPKSLTIAAGDTVSFYHYSDFQILGPHNVAADDKSFRCACGCDGEGGDGNPTASGACFGFTRTFSKPGRVGYRDEVSGAAGEIIIKADAFNIGAGMTGAWFDPAQGGHGLLLQVLPENQFLAAWLAFSPSGEQSWFMGVGTHAGNTATVTSVDQPTGGRWIPNFDASRIVLSAWGTLTFTFTDCNNGRVDFDSRTSYGSGSMTLRRLTAVAGVACP